MAEYSRIIAEKMGYEGDELSITTKDMTVLATLKGKQFDPAIADIFLECYREGLVSDIIPPKG